MTTRVREQRVEREGSVRRNVRTVAALEEATSNERTTLDRLSDLISRFAGGPWFVIVHVLWFASWIAFSAWSSHAFDPWPYSLLTFLVSIEAIFLSSFILIAQNHFEKIAERRAHLDLQINLLAEEEMTKVLQSLDLIGKRLGIDDLLGSIDADDLAKDTSVEHVARVVTEQTKK